METIDGSASIKLKRLLARIKEVVDNHFDPVMMEFSYKPAEVQALIQIKAILEEEKL